MGRGVRMPPVEHLHLEHVLQTVCALEAVVLRCFGPEGGQVLFTRDTGQVMLSCSGTRILTALKLEQPLARMVVECVWKHSTKTGDGSKTFIILLASLLRMIHTIACKEPNVSHTYNSREAAEAATARRLAHELLAFASEELDDLIAVGVAPHGCCLPWEDFTAKTQSPAHTNTSYLKKLVASFFLTRLGHIHCDFIADLICELLTDWKFKDDPPSSSLQFINDNFLALHTPVSGFPVSCSRLLEGQVIHRDFATPCPQTDHQPVKAVVFTGYLQPQLLNAGDVLELMEENTRKERSIVQFSAWAERSLECVIAKLQNLGVSVLLSAVKQSDAVLALATQAEMCVVECVSEDELSLFAHLSRATPISDCWMIQPEHVATLTFCRPILLGAHRYVHMGFHDSEESVVVRPCSIVICGPGEGQTDQYARAFQDAIRMLLTTWEPMHMTATTASKRTLLSHKITSVHMDNQNDRTRSASSNAPPFQKCVLEPGCVIHAGGTFEFLLHQALLQHGHNRSVSDHTDVGVLAVSQLMANALLSVPQQIYSHSPRRFLQTQTKVLCSIQNHSHPFSVIYKQEHNTSPTQGSSESECPLEAGKLSMYCYRKADVKSKVFMLDSGLESVSCKYQLVLAVLQCVTNLLRVDTMLCTQTHSYTKSGRLAKNISWEDTEDEAED
ncbi:Bardet-Biedl syndrome 10 protein isoform X1 [Thunnus albacares]|uniref:Bardet-Biedl syndrome 10 protein isoform X1 n=2 Tax=Thunnus albacares TaxID=8236 RepID=UPI001CF6FEC7|nr:Bardet-Biedl syndrome 10 protein isoform X1 [Thunnus albacares]XP_044211705.1 Bardet-Biedl syndrome 10 protein isoform X1 [Thunnus albacares]XP_044211706.1 Bardet-Biedl syndrome 10 protein isoform X1 [Thunnus albacares]XP_044211707.1 Bardet-Biedl syndrome 10 protein isoform X1 [Thunnus albacares]XP_044211708.1 Bardet-Biedl syndrome 10 protein isoform X1 [Thunnus albacares]XP_044211709.1 Bardet-Biedl syndrome 10 protein isoform X1 [Thunnus albacares]XP_044211711.1 Bardet-Biedl syndrome 10 p